MFETYSQIMNAVRVSQKLLCCALLCCVVYLGRVAFLSGKGSAPDRLLQFSADELKTALGDETRIRGMLAAFHAASLQVVPYSDPRPQVELAFSLGRLPAAVDRQDGCKHLWDMLRISRRLSADTRHALFSQAFYGMSICVADPAESRRWLVLAEQEAFWAKQFKTSSLESVRRRNEMFEAIVRRRRLLGD